MVIVINHGAEPFVVKPGERIAQLVIAPVTRSRARGGRGAVRDRARRRWLRIDGAMSKRQFDGRGYDDDDSATEIYDGQPRPPKLQVISMKSPAEIASAAPDKTPDLAKPQLRSLARRQPTPPSGNLAPPRISRQSIRRQLFSPVALGAILAIAAGVGLAIWLLARR